MTSDGEPNDDFVAAARDVLLDYLARREGDGARRECALRELSAALQRDPATKH